MSTQDEVVERVARALMRARGQDVLSSDEHWSAIVSAYRIMCAEHPHYAEGGDGVSNAFRDARTALSAMPGWQPIETAERDGTSVLARCRGAADCVVAWNTKWKAWQSVPGLYARVPTHYIPIPPFAPHLDTSDAE